MIKRYRTQWAAQFYVAAELTRREYLVSLTLGNAPTADLLVVSPSQTHFMVDVKGLSTRNFWLIRRREPRDDLFYVLVFLPKNYELPKFYILSCRKLMQEIDNDCGEEYGGRGEGINWGTALKYEDQWDILPG